ncbi:hypothetical protein BC830DRAFT_1109581 [Chytriomyces sp. MP71]|nr:hypothetical protein BC830DRAFT_1109581 [Chytriomyces sp. MP71]
MNTQFAHKFVNKVSSTHDCMIMLLVMKFISFLKPYGLVFNSSASSAILLTALFLVSCFWKEKEGV